MNEVATTNSETATYTPRTRRADKELKKPLIYPGNLLITGCGREMRAEIDRLCPDDGNRRRESLILTETWEEHFGPAAVPKCVLIAMAALAFQATTNAFKDQPRKNGKVETGFARAKCTMSKTCTGCSQKNYSYRRNHQQAPGPPTGAFRTLNYFMTNDFMSDDFEVRRPISGRCRSFSEMNVEPPARKFFLTTRGLHIIYAGVDASNTDANGLSE